MKQKTVISPSQLGQLFKNIRLDAQKVGKKSMQIETETAAQREVSFICLKKDIQKKL